MTEGMRPRSPKVGIAVDNQNKLHVNGREISEQQLSDQVKQLLGDAGAGDRTVLLKIHSEAQAMRYEKVLEAVGLAGGEIVHVLNKKE